MIYVFDGLIDKHRSSEVIRWMRKSGSNFDYWDECNLYLGPLVDEVCEKVGLEIKNSNWTGRFYRIYVADEYTEWHTDESDEFWTLCIYLNTVPTTGLYLNRCIAEYYSHTLQSYKISTVRGRVVLFRSNLWHRTTGCQKLFGSRHVILMTVHRRNLRFVDEDKRSAYCKPLSYFETQLEL